MRFLDADHLPKLTALMAVIAGDTDDAFTQIQAMTEDERAAFTREADTLRMLLEYGDPRCGMRLDPGTCQLRPGHGSPCTP